MPAYEIDPCHRLMIEYVERLLSGKIKKLAIVTPPRIGKTTLCNILAPAFVLGKDPTERIISVSYGSELSETWGRRLRNLLSDPDFQRIFPACKLSADSAAAYRFETSMLGEYSATGRGGPITGKGASLLILDDLIKDAAEANSEATCRSTIEWLQSTAFTRVHPNGRILAVGTRWSQKDPLGWVMAEPGWTILHLPALAQAKDPLGRRPGEALWPSHYPTQVLERIRVDVGSRVFETLFQGNVAAAAGSVFKRNWFVHYQQRPESFKRILQSWDTGFKSGAANDYSVCITIGEASNAFYLLSLYREKIEFPELKRKVNELADQWRPQEILIEDRGSGQSLIQELKVSTSYPVIAVKADKDKETRAASVTGYFEAQKVLFPDPQSAPWVLDLEDELASFPGGRFDDQVDAITQALNRLRDSSGGILGWVVALRDWASGKRPLPGKAAAAAAPAASAAALPQASSKPTPDEVPPCPACRSKNTIWLPGGLPGKPLVIHCNECKADDGVAPPKPGPADAEQCWVNGCKMKVREISGAGRYCANHGQESVQLNQARQMSRAQYENLKRRSRWN
jgi:predicted phage terminase large subunit-like protein